MNKLDPNALVMVVDDDPVQRLTRLNQLFFNVGIPDLQILLINGGDEAIRILEGGANVKLVITDLDMPGLGSGEKLIKWLRPSGVASPIPIIIVSENWRVASRLQSFVNAVWKKTDTLSDPAGFAADVKKLLGIS